MNSTEDIFTESDEWIAAEVRQLFRAHRARDAKAAEVTLFYFKEYLQMTLSRHLRKCDPEWDNSSRILDSSAHRWFDGLKATPEYLAVGRLRLRGEISWVIGQSYWYYDPFDFEIQLCPTTSDLRGYVLRFGDHRSLSDKVSGVSMTTVPVGGRFYEFARGYFESGEGSC